MFVKGLCGGRVGGAWEEEGRGNGWSLAVNGLERLELSAVGGPFRGELPGGRAAVAVEADGKMVLSRGEGDAGVGDGIGQGLPVPGVRLFREAVDDADGEAEPFVFFLGGVFDAFLGRHPQQGVGEFPHHAVVERLEGDSVDVLGHLEGVGGAVDFEGGAGEERRAFHVFGDRHPQHLEVGDGVALVLAVSAAEEKGERQPQLLVVKDDGPVAPLLLEKVDAPFRLDRSHSVEPEEDELPALRCGGGSVFPSERLLVFPQFRREPAGVGRAHEVLLQLLGSLDSVVPGVVGLVGLVSVAVGDEGVVRVSRGVVYESHQQVGECVPLVAVLMVGVAVVEGVEFDVDFADFHERSFHIV